jgi:hypothetical protein
VFRRTNPHRHEKNGLSFGYEIARGAESTSLNEAVDLRKRLAKGEKLMTSSYCAAHNILMQKHIPDLKSFVSSTDTLLFYPTEYVREQHMDAALYS